MSDNNQNTMIELTRTNKITIGVVAVLIVLLLGFIFLKPVEYTFNTKLEKELAEVNHSDYKVSPQELAKIILNKGQQKIILVDVRSEHEYAKGHFPDAKSIAAVNLFEKGNIDFFKNAEKADNKVILYGASADEANVPFMILKQMGLNNISYLTVGYEALKTNEWAAIAVDTLKYDDETAIVDFAQFIEDAKNEKEEAEQTSVKKIEPKTNQPKIVTPVITAPAGNEDEGC